MPPRQRELPERVESLRPWVLVLVLVREQVPVLASLRVPLPVREPRLPALQRPLRCTTP